MLTLYYMPGACSMVSHIALEEAGAQFETVLVDFARRDQLKPEFLRVNPKARVPALATERGVITENIAILSYIAHAFPAARLAPIDDPYALAQLQSFHAYIATTIHVTFRQISRPDYYADGEEAARALRAKVSERANEQFALIEDMLRDGRQWVHGHEYSLSDAYLFVFATYLRNGNRGDPSRFPLVMQHRERVRARPAVEHVLEREGLAASW